MASSSAVRSELDVIIFIFDIYISKLSKSASTNPKYNVRDLYLHFVRKNYFRVDERENSPPLFLVTADEAACVLPAIDLGSAMAIAKAHDKEHPTAPELLACLFESGSSWPTRMDFSIPVWDDDDMEVASYNALALEKLRAYTTGAWFKPVTGDMASYLALVRRATDQCASISDKHIAHERYHKVLAACDSFVPAEFSDNPTAWSHPFKALATAVADLDWYGTEEEHSLEARARMRSAAVDLILSVMINRQFETNPHLAFYYVLEGQSGLVNAIMRDPFSEQTMAALLPGREEVERVVENAWKYGIQSDDYLRVRDHSALKAAVPEHYLAAMDMRVASAKAGGAIYLPDLLPEAVKRIVGVDTAFEYSDVPAFIRLAGQAWKMLFDEEARREAAGIAQPITLAEIKKAGGAPVPPPMPEPRQPPKTVTPRSTLLEQIRAGPTKSLRRVEVAPADVAERDISMVNSQMLRVSRQREADALRERRAAIAGSDENDGWSEDEAEAEAEALEADAAVLKDIASGLRDEEAKEQLEERAEELEEQAEEIMAEEEEEEPVSFASLASDERAYQQAQSEAFAVEKHLRTVVSDKQFAVETLSRVDPPNFDVSMPAVGMVSTRKPLYGAINFSDKAVTKREISSFQRGLKFSEEIRKRIDSLRRLGPYTPRKVLRSGELEDAQTWYRRNRRNAKESFTDFVSRNKALLTPSMTADQVYEILTYNTEILARLLEEGFSAGRDWNDAWKFVSRELTVSDELDFSKFLFMLGAISRVPTVRGHLDKLGRAPYDHRTHWDSIADHIAANPAPSPKPEEEPEPEPEADDVLKEEEEDEEPEEEEDEEPEEEEDEEEEEEEEVEIPEGYYHAPLAEPYAPREEESMPIGAKIDTFVWGVEDAMYDMARRARTVLNEKAAQIREMAHRQTSVVQVSGSAPDTGRFDAVVRKQYGEAPFRPGNGKTLARVPDTQMALLDVESRTNFEQRGFVRQCMLERRQISPDTTRLYTIDGVRIEPISHPRMRGQALDRAMASDDAPPLVLAHPPISAFAFLGE